MNMAGRYLIVNADDLGMSSGINAGILEAHRDGIVTSASWILPRCWPRRPLQWIRAERLSAS